MATALDDKISILFDLAKGAHPAVKGGLDTVQALRMVRDTAESALQDAVRLARAEGATWDDVGRMLGTTRQAAWEKYG